MRLADLLAGLSRLADLGFGLPVGTSLRSCALAARMAGSLGLSAEDAQASFYTALLHHVGCVGYAHETARLFGDELAVNRAAARTDLAAPSDLLTTFLPSLLHGRRPLERARIVRAAVLHGGRWGDAFTTTACELGRESARRLGLPAPVQTSLLHVYDLWRGERRAGALRGEDLPVGSRVARLTGVAAFFECLGGPEHAAEAVRRRGGGMLDPVLAADFAEHATTWLAELTAGDPRELVLEAEPTPHVTVSDVCSVAEVFADLADLKSPWLLGHSRGVAALASGAAVHLGLPERARRDLEVAALLHDVGRVAVTDAVWDKPGPLTTDEWEQVRLHPYQSERVLVGSEELAPLAPLVGRHHERLDGSGYYRGSAPEDLSTPARALAAADTYQALTEARPHRPAREPAQAERELLDEVGRGALDADAARAVLLAAGHRPRAVPARRLPSGLTDREVEVLDLLAHGCSNADIAARLVISRRTAEHHVQHLYTKIGVSNRAAATLFAVEHRLVGPDR